MKHKTLRLAPLLTFIALMPLVSCSQSGETNAVCSRAPELESSIVAVDAAVVSMSDVSARQLQSMFAVLLSSLVSIGEVAPPDLVDQFALGSVVPRAVDYRSTFGACQLACLSRSGGMAGRIGR
jgi:hypothetical protein